MSKWKNHKLLYIVVLTVALLLIAATVALASSVDVAVVDVTAPTGSVTLAPGGNGAITINLSITGKQEGTATFKVNRDWSLSGGVFTGSNPQTFTVAPRAATDPATTFSTSGTVSVAAGQAAGIFTLAVSAFDITNSNTTGAKLSDGSDSSYAVKVEIPTPTDTTPPVIAPHADVTAEATSASGAIVSYTSPATSDAVDGAGTATCAPASGTQFDLGNTTVTCNATDAAGNAATPTTFVVYVVDTTAPVIAAHLDVTAEATSALGALVTYTSPATSDAVDGAGVATCLPSSGTQFALGNTTVTCNATDAASNVATPTTFVVHVVDTTPPVIAAHLDVTEEATSAAGALVSYTSPTTSDAVDGPGTATCAPSSGSTFALGDTTITCNATDAAGNAATPTTFKVSVVDTTPPTIDTHANVGPIEATGPTGAVATYTAPATHDLVDGDDVATCLPASGSTLALGNTTVTCNATDKAGNAATPTTFSVTVVDTTPPTITLVSRLPAANSFGWNKSDVTVTWSCSDLVGVVEASVSQTVSAEGANQSATGTCVDTSGNKASDTQTGINIDLTAPSLTWVGGPADGASYYFGFVPAAPTCTAADLLSGPDGCNVTGYGTAVGSHTMTATAYDKAGNSKEENRTYTVLAWDLKGFYQPVDMNGVYNTVKGGSTVPLKFEIFASTELTDITYIQSLSASVISCSITATDAIEITATGGTTLRYDPIAGQFIFNWQTPKTPGACYLVTMTTLDGSSLVAYFKLK
jgi:hypothetical protein